MSRRVRITACALLGVPVALVLAGGVAVAAWTTSGPGTVSARAGTLVAPVVRGQSCDTLRTTWVWTAVPRATGYDVEQTPGGQTSQTGTSFTTPAGSLNKIYTLRVRASAGTNWKGPWSNTVSTLTGPCGTGTG